MAVAVATLAATMVVPVSFLECQGTMIYITAKVDLVPTRRHTAAMVMALYRGDVILTLTSPQLATKAIPPKVAMAKGIPQVAAMAIESPGCTFCLPSGGDMFLVGIPFSLHPPQSFRDGLQHHIRPFFLFFNPCIFRCALRYLYDGR